MLDFMKGLLRPFKQRWIPFPYNQGIEFTRIYNESLESQWWSKDSLQELQFRRLKALLKHAYQNVPYHRRIFEERNLKPRDFQCFEDLQKLPVLTKEDVRTNFHALISQHFHIYRPAVFHTSGSTGEPLNYYLDRRTVLMTSACVQRHWRWCGVGPNDLIAVCRGTLIDDFGKKRSNHYKLQDKQLHFSTFEMNDAVMAKYISLINDTKPSMIRGYPASIEILAKFIIKNDMNVWTPKAIHTSSETVSEEQRRVIEKAFHSPLFDWYGHGESTLCAGECDQHTGLHLNLEYGYTEFVKTQETANMPGVFNIISTSLHNYSFPLIRYDTEDLALLGDKLCSCGRGLPLIKKIIGREADIIKGVNGVAVSPSSFVHFWKYKVADHLEGIKYVQIVQKKVDCITVKIVGQQKVRNQEIILDRIHLLLGDIQVDFEYLPQIPTGQKWRFTVSQLRIKD
jgi:phenylacetate-CoA ligase